MDQTNDKDIIKEKIKKLDKQINLLTTLRQNLINKLNTSEPSDLSIARTTQKILIRHSKE